MQPILNRITDYLIAQSWQIAILVVLVSAASILLRRRSAHVRYLLWLAVLAKCIIPPVFAVSLPVLPGEVGIEIPRGPATGSAIAVIDLAAAGDSAVEIPVATTSGGLASVLADITMHQWFTIIWLAVLTVFLGVVTAKAVRINRRIKAGRRPIPAELQSVLDRLCSSFDIKTSPQAWLLRDCDQPFVWGLPRGAIYLPIKFADLNQGDSVDSILAHELCHVTRCDAIVNLLQIAAQAVFWFHPLTWWANQKLRREREKCCDETVIAALGAEPSQYGRAIIDVLTASQDRLALSSLAVAGPVKNIEDRVRTIMNPKKTFCKRPRLAAVLLILAVIAATVSTSLIPTARGTRTTEPVTEVPGSDSGSGGKAAPPEEHVEMSRLGIPQVMFDCKVIAAPSELKLWKSDDSVQQPSIRVDADYARECLELVRDNKDVRLLSAPRMIVLDGEEGVLVVGSEIPYTAGFSTAAAGEEAKPIISYVKVGMELKLEAQVSPSNGIRVVIEFEQRSVQLASGVDDLGREIHAPIINSTSTVTQVATESGKPIVIAGLQHGGEEKSDLILIVTARVIADEHFEIEVDPIRLTASAAVYAAQGDFTAAVKLQERAIRLMGPKSVVGVGVEIEKSTGVLRVVRVIPGGPAEKAGLKPGDAILKIDGESVDPMTLPEVAEMIRGEEGTDIVVIVRSPDADKVRIIQMTREKMSLEPETLDDYRLRIDAYKAGKTLEDALKADEPVADTARGVHIYRLSYADAGDLATILSKVFTDEATSIIADKESRRVIVNATLEQKKVIEALLEYLDRRPEEETAVTVVEIFELTHIDAQEAMRMLTSLMQDSDRDDDVAMVIVVDDKGNRLILRGTAERLVEAKQLIKDLDVPGRGPGVE